MSKKQIVFDEVVREKISKGIKQLSAAVKTTLGPTGRVVMIERDFGDPYVTKDGVTVAKEIDLTDPFENMGAQMVKQVTSKTSTVAGDGTTTATIYAEAIYLGGLKSVTSGAKPQEVKRGIDKAVEAVIEELGAMAKPVTSEAQILQVAVCSANQDTQIGAVVADAINRVGKDGVVTIEEGRTLETYVDVVEGMQFNRGFVHAAFANAGEGLRCEYDSPMVLITDYKLSAIKSVMPILEKVIKDGSPLVIIADDIADETLATLVINFARGVLKAVGVKAPGFGDRRKDTLEDIAILTGGTLISREAGRKLEEMTLSQLGRCKRVVIDQETTTIVEGAGGEEAVAKRIEHIRTRLSQVANDFDKEHLQERLAKLQGGVARIVVGGTTEAVVREKKDRIDDALHACKAAADEGILPGGGVAPIYASRVLDDLQVTEDEAVGVNIIRRALEAPLRQIAINTGMDAGEVMAEIKRGTSNNFGYDAANGRYVDMVSAGIIVPSKVERVALQNAASVAGLLLTTDCMVSIIPGDKVDMGMPA